MNNQSIKIISSSFNRSVKNDLGKRCLLSFSVSVLLILSSCDNTNREGGISIIPLDSTKSIPSMRFFGEKTKIALTKKKPEELANVIVGFNKNPSEEFRPVPIAIGPPLIEPRGMVKGKGYLYISDSGHDETHADSPTIWRLDPVTKKLDVLYRGPLLVNSKWLWFVEGTNGKSDELLISDFGEETSHHREGNGVGAKVFAIQILPDGSAGKIRILHQGAPFRDPQGITVIGETVIVADTRAGEERSRTDAPEVKFANGVVFALPLKGGKPVRLFSDELFVTLVGSCTYFDGNQQYLRLWDIDGGRRDTSKYAWMPHSGFAQLKRAKIESINPLKFGPLEIVPFIEEFPVELKIDELKEGNKVVLHGLNETTLAGGNKDFVLPLGERKIIAESPTSESDIKFEVTVFDGDKPIFGPRQIEIPKDINSLSRVARDNKHAGALMPFRANWVDGTVDGLSKTVGLFPRQGGVITFLWQGAPLATPMASQPSWDFSKIYVTDLNGGPKGSGAVWELALPSVPEISLMYSHGNAWKVNKDN